MRAMVALMAALLLSGPGPAAAAAGRATPGGTMGWIVGAGTLADLLAHDSGGVVARELDHPTTYVAGAHSTVPPGWSVTRAETFTDADALVAAVDGGTLPPGLGAVLLDIEAWQFTPVEQQRNPGPAYARAAAAAHAHGLRLVATPAMDLVNVLGRRPGESVAAAYLRLRIAAITAAHADVFEVQSQGLELDPTTFARTLTAAAAQARGANRTVVVFGGVTTNHSGQTATAQQMAAAVHAAGATVAGYWLNDPAGGPFCPKCTGPYPAVAVRFLADIARG